VTYVAPANGADVNEKQRLASAPREGPNSYLEPCM
jgi:hypothetical protein